MSSSTESRTDVRADRRPRGLRGRGLRDRDTRRPLRAGGATLGLVVGLALAGCTASGPADGPVTPGTPTTASTPATPAAPAANEPPRPVVDVPVRASGLETLTDADPVPPVSLTIAAAQIEVPIDPVGVQPDGQMEIPPLAERAGWYRHGAAPGRPTGTAVVAAHVDSVASAGLGPFARLQDVVEGDVVEVVLADGSVVRYAVSSVERTAKPAVPWGDVFVRDGDARLVLVTCGGTFAPDAGAYSDNVIVTALPLPGG